VGALMEIMHRHASLNRTAFNVQFLLSSRCKLKLSKETVQVLSLERHGSDASRVMKEVCHGFPQFLKGKAGILS
jgi:hypothetical protein